MRKLKLLLALLFVASVGLLSAQTKVINGQVVSAEDNSPIVGARVVVKGTTVGDITDQNGKFKIQTEDGKILEVTYLGMKPIEVKAKDRMVIKLNDSSTELDEVMVVAYGTAKKSTFSGSASVVKADKLGKVQNASISKALEGAAAGVQVVSGSGAPGSDASIKIRGIGSINASSSPLYVLDGVPYAGTLTSISPQDIESVTVLKDAAANSLYGARGANGVILITTKKGKSGVTNIKVDIKTGVTSRGIPNYDVIDSPKDYYELAWESLRNNYYYKLGNSYAQSGKLASNNLIAKLGGYNNYDVNGDGVIDAIDNQLLIGANGMLNPNAKLMYHDNWYDEMFRTGARQEYQASISGGVDKTNYYFSLGYLNDKGYITGSDYKRYNTRLRLETVLKDWLKVGANFAYSKELTNWISQNSTQGNNMFYISQVMAPIYPVYSRDGHGEKIIKDGAVVYDYGDGILKRPVSSMANPVGAQSLDMNYLDYNVFNGKAFAEVRFLKDFKFTANASIDNLDGISTNYLNGKYGQFKDSKGILTKSVDRITAYNTNQLLTWSKDFGEHNFDVLVGHELYYTKSSGISAKKEKFLDPASRELVGAIKNPSASSSSTEYKTEGFLSRLQYDYLEKYFLSASFRRDGSSRFHPDHRWGNFWSVGLAWRMDKEDFIQSIDWIDELKLKASYGTQGNDAIGGVTPYLDQYVVVPNGDDFALKFSYKGNKLISWEKNGSFNTGVDFTILDNRVIGTLEYFSRTTRDMLFSRPLATSTGINSYPDNIGNMINRGFEAELIFKVLKNRKIDWDINLNATHYNNKITKLPPENVEKGIITGNFKYMEGKSIYEYFIEEFAGLNEEGVPTYYKDILDKDEKVTGREVTSDYSKATRYYTGESAIPDLYGGIGTTITAYGIDLSIQTNYQIGGKGYDYAYSSLMNTGSTLGKNYHKDVFNRWTENNKNTNVPRLQEGNSDLSHGSNYFLIDASYFNIKNISLGYSFPSKLVKKLNIEKIRIYAVADNVALFSKRKGYDPRMSFSGYGNVGQYSASRTVSIGLNLNF